MINQAVSVFAPLSDLTGIAAEAAKSLSTALNINTIAELAESPHFTFAAELVEAASDRDHILRRFGVPGGRVMKGFEARPVKELASAPLSALEGIGKQRERQLTKTLGVKTLRELARWPSFLRAREIMAEAVRDGIVTGKPKVFRVSGLVVRSDGTPVVDAAIKVSRQGIRKMTPLGKRDTVKTKGNGNFIFEYERPDTAGDLRVELIADRNKGVDETRPRVIGQAGSDERITFVVGDETFRGLSTFERLVRAMERVLDDEGVKPPEIAGFDQQTLARLSLTAGIEPRTLILLSQGYALAKETGLPADVFFAMGREKVSIASLPALLVQDPEKRREAVKRALAANHISSRLERETARVLDKLDEFTVVEALKKPAAANVSSVGSVLEGARLSAAKRKKLVDAYIQHTGSAEEFWQATRTNGDLSNAEVDRVQFELQLAVVTQNHVPLNKALKANGVAKLADLAAFDKQGLLSLIKGGPGGPGVGLPADLAAAGTSEEGYADFIFRVVEDAFPTAMVALRVDNFPDSQRLKGFLDNNLSFDLRRVPVRTYLEQNPRALDFAADATEREAITKGMKRLERAYRIAPPGARVQTMEVLLNDGLDSAHKVRALGRTAFLRRHKEVLGKDRAERVFRRANNASAVAEIVAARHSAASDATPVYVLPQQSISLKGLSFAEMFGGLDFCSCQHCQSVFSPTAYLVDVLHWLDERPATLPDGKSALDLLFENRRADIGGIELSCANTNTPLPYIDIVNESLESLVLASSAPMSLQTTGTAADLRAHPEHLLDTSYKVLAGADASRPVPDNRDAVYPFNLPFNLWLEEARIYLGQLGMPRYRLMEALQGVDAARVDSGVAMETLGMSSLEWDIIADQAQPNRTIAELWGLASDPDFVTTLANTSTFLEQATPPISEHGMAFSELAELLRSDFVQQPSPVQVAFTGSTCNTEQATLGGLSENHLGLMHRFIRLWRCLGWSALDLDRAIQILGVGTLDDSCLRKIAHVRRLTAELNLAVSEVLTWWGSLDTRRWNTRLAESPTGNGFELTFDNQIPQPIKNNEDASPYETIFQNASVAVNPSNAFDVNATGEELKTPGALGDQGTPIASALGITADELAELLPHLSRRNGQPNPTPEQLNLANLSALYARVSLARGLDLGIRDFLSVLVLTGIDPFVVDNTESTLDFVDQVHFIRDSAFSIDELNYLLRNVDTKPATLELDDTHIGVLFFELGSALRVVEAQYAAPASSTTEGELHEQLAQALKVLLEGSDVNEALAFIDIDPQNGQSPPATAAQFIDDKLAAVLDAEDTKAKLALENDPVYLNTRLTRLEYALGVIAAHLRETGKAATIIERMASNIGLEQSVCAPLLREHLLDPGGSGRPILEVFSDAVVRDYEKTEEGSDEPILPKSSDLPDQFSAYRLLHKAGVILNRLSVDKNELSWVLVQGPDQGALDFQSLPIETNAASASYEGWMRLQQVVGLRDRFAPREVFDLFEAAADPQAGDPTYEALLTELERRSRWDQADIEYLVGSPARPNESVKPGALGFVYPQDWKDERPLVRLAEVMAMVHRVGLSAQTIWEWRLLPIPANATPGAQQTTIDVQKTQATQIKQAVRARYNESQWYEIAPGLRDRLREHQRDALVGWLIGNDDRFSDSSGLFEHLLLDVQMSPCQLTSRVKQAIGSTQLFVQRLLMGLEVSGSGQSLVELSKAEAAEWAWQKNYRVWEANRKVFLYPENWLEPELRDNKTPFFVEMENELLQNDVTTETAETAVRDYLQKLDEVARLEIVGLCEQKDESTDILHIFGRTREIPPTYYHRKRIHRLRWTPWEKVETGIEGDHLIPVIFNRSLYLFWPQITEAAVEESSVKIPSEGGTSTVPVQKFYKIGLQWSRLLPNDTWAAKKMAKVSLGAEILGEYDLAFNPGLLKSENSSTADFSFRQRKDGDDLLIEPVRRQRRPGVTALIISPASSSNSGDRLVADPGEPDDDDGDPLFGYTLLHRFRIGGCDQKVTVEPPDEGQRIVIRRPTATDKFGQQSEMITSGQVFFQPSGGGLFELPAGKAAGATQNPVLDLMTTPLEIVPMDIADSQEGEAFSAKPFFYQDSRRTFFVQLRSDRSWLRDPPEWVNTDSVLLDPMRFEPETGLPRQPSSDDPWRYDPGAVAAFSRADGVTVGGNPGVSVTDGGLAALAGIASASPLGARFAFIGGAPVDRRSKDALLHATVRVVDRNGTLLAASETPSAAGVKPGSKEVRLVKTVTMPAVTTSVPTAAPVLKFTRTTRYQFDVFYHPYLCMMLGELNRFGLDGLFDPLPESQTQLLRQQKEDRFFAAYGPKDAVHQPFPIDRFDFSPGGAYSLYNWEIFFHVPFSVACQLSQNQRFAEAQKWFHYIFDPTETEGTAPQRFWKVKPFFELFNDETADTGPIAELLLLLQYDGSEPDKLRMRDELIEEVAAWRANPFSPHALARLRLTVYARAVVMKYIDNLIEWGDQLFRHDTMESINEATQLYTLAAQLLGRQPRKVEREPRNPQTFSALRQAGLDTFGNVLVEEIEGMLPEITETEVDIYQDDIALTSGTLFFCVPPNQKLLVDYWDRVADRLFKVRHCMNIEGVMRQLPFFEPPIDPALLVRAKAAGVDLASALSDLNAPFPYYRHQMLSQKATELCSDVRSLGQALLSALEKKDAEELALIRAGYQVNLEDALTDVRERQIGEAKEALKALERSKENAEIRRDYYRSRDYMNLAEKLQFTFSSTADVLELAAVVALELGTVVAALPDFTFGVAGFGGSPLGTATEGGTQGSNSAAALASGLRTGAGLADRGAQMAGLFGNYERRSDDWGLQGDTAEKEIETLERQIFAAEIRVEIAEKERDNLKLQLEQSKETEAFLRDKYSNVQLYQWMIGQLSSLHFQSYQLAYDLAKRAERAWQFELAIEDKTFIQFGYWDSLKKGLLAGERLHHDIKRMDVAYLDANKREYELVRNVSLRDLDPVALLRLRQDGECFVDVPEACFDLATPGHYMRRLKTVALSIPSVTGPYTPVPCTLTLESNSIRTSPDTAGGYGRNKNNPDSRFRDNVVGLQSIVTSQAQQDSGLFETSLRDDRYLPFEGAGAISRWKLELPKEFRQFDYETISDVILHIRYTAREGGGQLRDEATEHVKSLVKDAQAVGSVRLFSVRHEFPTEWANFQGQTPSQNRRFKLSLELRPEYYPFWSQGRLNSVVRVDVFAQSSEDVIPGSMEIFETDDKNDTATRGTLTRDAALGNLLSGPFTSGLPAKPDGEIKLFTDANTLSDLWIALTWSE